MKNLIHLFRPSQPGTLALFLSAALAGFCGPASAAFFQLAENNASGIGNAFAGGAAIAEDASTVWSNPAGLTRLSGSQIVAAGHFINPSTKFTKTSANLSPTLGGGAISGGEGGDAGQSAIVPNIYYSQQLSDRFTLGVGINAPFGLATEYENGWVGRYHAIRSEIQTVNINPSLAYKINDQWSVGGGVNYQKLDAELTNAVDYGSICALGGAPFAGCATPGANDGSARVEADDDAWGFNLGGLWQVTNDTRVGIAYRSKMKYKLKGTSDVTAPSALAASAGSAVAGIVDANVTANVTVPATFSLSAYQQLSPRWALVGDVTRTFWSKLPELRIDFDSSQSDSVITLGLKDVNRYSVGATFTPGGAWTYRAGIALDNTPTPNATERTARLPDENRLWLALGAGFKPSNALSFDFGYVYIKIDDASINKQAGTVSTGENFLRGSLVGTYEGTVQILSAQANWKF